MKKVLLLLFLFILSCQTNTCKSVSFLLSEKIADIFECENPTYFYEKFSSICPTNDPSSFIGNLGCKFVINYATSSVNEITEIAKCKKDIIDPQTKEYLIALCSTLIP